jgi:hypothetical protein
MVMQPFPHPFLFPAAGSKLQAGGHTNCVALITERVNVKSRKALKQRLSVESMCLRENGRKRHSQSHYRKVVMNDLGKRVWLVFMVDASILLFFTFLDVLELLSVSLSLQEK